MRKCVCIGIITLLLLSKDGMGQKEKADSLFTRVDTLKVDYIVFADLSTGVLIKRNNQTVIQRITMKKVPPFYLGEQQGGILLFDEQNRRIDWILYKIGDSVYSLLGQGSLSNIFFRYEAFHNAP